MLDSGQLQKETAASGDSGAAKVFIGRYGWPSDRVEFQCRAGVEVKIQVRGRLQLCDAGVQLFTLCLNAHQLVGHILAAGKKLVCFAVGLLNRVVEQFLILFDFVQLGEDLVGLGDDTVQTHFGFKDVVCAFVAFEPCAAARIKVFVQGADAGIVAVFRINDFLAVKFLQISLRFCICGFQCSQIRLKNRFFDVFRCDTLCICPRYIDYSLQR